MQSLMGYFCNVHVPSNLFYPNFFLFNNGRKSPKVVYGTCAVDLTVELQIVMQLLFFLASFLWL